LDIILDQSDAGRTRSVRPGDVVTIRLDETPTSGHRWMVEEIDPGVLDPAGDDFVPPAGAGRGGRGTRELRFRVLGPGPTRVRLALRRPWEGTAPVARRYETTIDATAEGR
jgi:inhibitor of cysteine peptidase